jgi:transcriptional regulator with XRE-family HTH domain
MTINERVKYLRKNILHLSQTDFANALGMKQTGISYMERDGSTVTDQTIKTICLRYKVNEPWLRTGTGEIFTQSATFCLDDFAKSRGATPMELELLKAYFELDPEIRKAVITLFKKHLSSNSDPAKAKIDQEVDVYRADLELEARQASSASDMPDAKEA